MAEVKIKKHNPVSAGRIMAALVVVLIMHWVQFSGYQTGLAARTDATMALGALLIMAWVMGDIFQRIALPRITGYMITGLLAGPYLLGLMTKQTVSTMKFIDNVALALIALHAGHEVKISLLRTRLKTILSVTFGILLFSLTGVFIMVMLTGRHLFPFLEDAPHRIVFIVALLFGLIEVAKSPVTTIAILDETKAKGPLSEITLGVVVLKDVILIVLFGVVMSITTRIAYPLKSQGSFFGETAWHLFGSLAAGTIIGFVIGQLLKVVKANLYLLIIGLALFLTLLSNALHLEVLLVCLTAGFIIQNYTGQGKRLLTGVERATPFVYLIFFPVASASLNLSLLKQTWLVCIPIILLRKVLVFTGINFGLRFAGDDFPNMRKYGWMGFINQSGVTLALALIIGKRFPEFGAYFKAIALGMIVMTDLYAPAMFKYALYRSGEIGKRKISST